MGSRPAGPTRTATGAQAQGWDRADGATWTERTAADPSTPGAGTHRRGARDGLADGHRAGPAGALCPAAGLPTAGAACPRRPDRATRLVDRGAPAAGAGRRRQMVLCLGARCLRPPDTDAS